MAKVFTYLFIHIDFYFCADKVVVLSSFHAPTDILRTLRDPEKDATLEDLEVIQEDKIKVSRS